MVHRSSGIESAAARGCMSGFSAARLRDEPRREEAPWTAVAKKKAAEAAFKIPYRAWEGVRDTELVAALGRLCCPGKAGPRVHFAATQQKWQRFQRLKSSMEMQL
ncbi:hypothetical protein H0E84_09865 [Luteimonas sp. SJ-92]|uniref:Uncharacterized protein n=1 Tax=Luteimonas salinisoli TaxID=2752307 RepID=A0A853JD71_9GAMM|nr:hypothetical protein [Luteimonas salinisoli]NZA26692.1 hypothetical protein [Luteimonas salinisoli]